jgi:hypothetical protein
MNTQQLTIDYHLFTDTQGNMSFVFPRRFVERGEAEFNNRVKRIQNSLFPEVPGNKGFVI